MRTPGTGGKNPVAATEAGGRALDALVERARATSELTDVVERELRRTASDLAITNDALQNVYDLYDHERARAAVLAAELSDARRLYHHASLELAAIKRESAVGLFLRKLLNRMPVQNGLPLFSRERFVRPRVERVRLRSQLRLRFRMRLRERFRLRLRERFRLRLRERFRPQVGTTVMQLGQAVLRAYRFLRMPRVFLPRITIVTPSPSDAPGIAQTVASIAAQHYPNVQHVVGSEATNVRSIAREIVGVLAAGNVLEPGALNRIARSFSAYSERGPIDLDRIAKPGVAAPMSFIARIVFEHRARAERVADWEYGALDAIVSAVSGTAANASTHTVGHAELAAWGTIPIARRFDVVRLNDPIGTFDDPLATLIALRLLVVPGGRLVLSLPNFDSAQREMFGPEWSGWDPERDRFIFGMRSFMKLVSLADLRVAALRTVSLPSLTLPSFAAGRGESSGELRLRAQGICDWSKIAFDPYGKGDVIVAALQWVG